MTNMLASFRRRFWLPPRAHGEIIEDRTVSFLELFYDLIYVVVIGRAAHHLALHPSWRGVMEFTVVFGLIWIAWINGTFYYELHGREDGRTRAFVFLQMLLLVALAIFTEGAAGEDGFGFAVVYTLYLLVLTWLWYVVRRRDSADYEVATRRYLLGMLISIVAVGASAFMDPTPRLIVWTLVVALWLVGATAISGSAGMSGLAVTDSMVERFGLFVIIVLGEVLVGVVGGMAEAGRTPRVILTGLLGTAIAFAYWWTYFDYVGRRLPIDRALFRVLWVDAHFPIHLSVAAAGAAMVVLVEHANDAHTPDVVAWILGGSVAIAVLALMGVMRTLRDYERLAEVYRPLMKVMPLAAVSALAIGAWAPAPPVMAGALVLVLAAVWWFAVSRWLRMEDPTQIVPGAGTGHVG